MLGLTLSLANMKGFDSLPSDINKDVKGVLCSPLFSRWLGGSIVS